MPRSVHWSTPCQYFASIPSSNARRPVGRSAMPKVYCPSSTGVATPPVPSEGRTSWLGRLKLRAMAEKAKCVLGRKDRAPVIALSESR